MMWNPEPRLTPPEPHRRIVDRCCVCGQDIYEHEQYYDFSGDAVHADCMHEYQERENPNG